MEGAGESREAGSPEVSEHGLKENAIGFRDALIIGIASTAPAYSLAAVIGLVVVTVGVQAPAVLPGLVHADVLRRHGVLLHEPRRPGLRHDVLVGDTGDGTVGRLDRGLGDLRDRHPGRGLPGRRGGPLHVPVLRPRRPRRLEGRDHAVRRDHHRRDDGHVRHRHRDLRPLPGHHDHRPGRGAPAFRRRGPGEGLRGHGPRRLAHPGALVVLALRGR